MGAPSESDRASDLVALANAAVETFRTRYGVTVDDKGRCGYVENDGTGIIRPCDRVSVEHAFIRAYGTQLMPSTIKQQLVTAWTAASAKIHFNAVRPFVFKSEAIKNGEFAWARMIFDPAPVACPEEFASILARTDQARSLVLWIGSVLDYEFPRVQYLHMYGAGSDGKSLLAQFLETTLGLQCSATMYPRDLSDSHGTAKLEGIRLASFKDQTDIRFVSSGAFKQITGDNTITINPKGQPHRNIALNCKVLIYSNVPPDLNGGHADLRRIVPVQFRKRLGDHDLEFEKRLLATGGQVLQYCYNEFLEWKRANPNKLLPTDANIVEDLKEESVEGSIEKRLALDFEIDCSKVTEEEWRVPSSDITLWAQANIEGEWKQVRSVLTSMGLTSMPYKLPTGSSRMWRGIRRRPKEANEAFITRPRLRTTVVK